MTDAEFPVDALEAAIVEIELGDSTYTWTEPGNRKCRGLLKQVIPIATDNGDLMDSSNAVGVLNAADDIQDFLYGAIPVPEEDRQRLDDTATPKQLIGAFNAISEVLQRPFAGSETSTDQETKAEE